MTAISYFTQDRYTGFICEIMRFRHIKPSYSFAEAYSFHAGCRESAFVKT